MREFDVDAGGGRVLRGYDVGATRRSDELAVLWHHGTPNIGAPPEPLFGSAAALGLRWIGFDRPGYGGSTARPGRSVATAAEDAALASIPSLSSVTRAADHAPWRVAYCWPIACSR